MKSILNGAKLAALMMIFALGFVHQAQAQRYLTERATTSYNITTTKEGVSNLHTFSNGLKLAVDRKGAEEKLIIIDDKGIVYSPASSTQLSVFKLSLNIKTNRCTVKVVIDRSKPDRKLDVEINCDLTN